MCIGTSSGRLSQLCHFGPIIAIFLIIFITFTGFNCLLEWWPPHTLDGQLHLIIYLFWPILIFYNYFNAVFIGPGFVPYQWKPENKLNEGKLQFCKLCNSFKAPRSHHCKKCNRCVMKMDHHCPWINTCCGHFNHASFVYFLFYAPLGCIHAIFVLGASIYRAIFKNYYIYYDIKNVPIVNLSIYRMVACMFAIGMAFGVAIAVGFLFIVQIKSIAKNQTGIESWIVKKANHRRQHFGIQQKFVYPYNLGWKENFRQVFNWNGNFRPIGNGIWWEIVDICDQFTLTMEQLAQKDDKKAHSIKYIGTSIYTGSIFPVKLGFKTAFCFPWSDEHRMPIDENDIILVTRWQKHWLYGEKKDLNEIGEFKSNRICKGWFPAKCVRLDEETGFKELNLHKNIEHEPKFIMEKEKKKK